jgi:hypothetical protein
VTLWIAARRLLLQTVYDDLRERGLLQRIGPQDFAELICLASMEPAVPRLSSDAEPLTELHYALDNDGTSSDTDSGCSFGGDF